ncbi:hypothetical protein TrLO_g14067 [Triparma laevis f. longispina]|uniref:Ion transport domain-containing protein n=1 Tax=Triparma laevis f. longispina TaxID=1714387 RepID=A0A9W7F4F7_9STRA|nr:hypothetical protein TrLO_g14067 [Triparma laevis f. longispina]
MGKKGQDGPDANLGESFQSTDSHDHLGEKKVKTFWPPKDWYDKDNKPVTYSFGTRIWLTLEDPSMGKAAKYMSLIMMILILASCIGFILASIPDNRFVETDMDRCRAAGFTVEVDCDLTCFDDDSARVGTGNCDQCAGVGAGHTYEVCEPQEFPFFGVLETICIYCFTLDYLLRISTVPGVDPEAWGGKASLTSSCSKVYNYATGVMNLVDFVAIMPFWIEVIMGSGVPLGFLRVLRLARVFRIFKLGKYNEGMSLFARTLHASTPALSLLCFFVLIGVVLFGSIIFFVEGGTYMVDPTICPEELDYACYVRGNSYSGDALEMSPFVSIPFSFYWVMVTMTTVGYGDQFPQTGLGKFITVICMLCGILTLALPITVLGSNFSAEYEAMHGNHNDNEAAIEEEKFWEHFASLVANSMVNDSNTRVPINSQKTKERLREMIMTQAQVPAEVGLGGGSIGGGGSPTALIANLEITVASLNATLDALRAGGGGSGSKPKIDSRKGSMVVEDIDSPNPSPVMFEDQQKTNKVTRYGASGGASNFNRASVRRKHTLTIKSGQGVLPCYFDVYTPNRREKSMLLRDSTQVHFSPNISPRSEEGEGGAVEDDLEISEMEKIVDIKPSATTKAPPAGGLTLNLRRGSKSSSTARLKLTKLGKSLSFGSNLMQTKKKRESCIGETSRRLSIVVGSASGIALEGVKEASEGEVKVSIVAGGSQFETTGKKVEIGSVDNSNNNYEWNEQFEYAVPLSTHSGNALVENLELLVHVGKDVVGAVTVPLTSVSGSEVEYRLITTNNHYLKHRVGNASGANKVIQAGSGRIKVKMNWLKVLGGAHKYGMSFGKLLTEGKDWKGGDKHDKCWRDPPVYPKLRTSIRRKSKEGKKIIVMNSGEHFLFEEGSGNSSSGNSGPESYPLFFPENMSDGSRSNEPSYNSPTISPGRSDTENSSEEEVKVVSFGALAEKQRRAEASKIALVDDFLHNTHKAQSPKKGSFASFFGGGKVGVMEGKRFSATFAGEGGKYEV